MNNSQGNNQDHVTVDSSTESFSQASIQSIPPAEVVSVSPSSTVSVNGGLDPRYHDPTQESELKKATSIDFDYTYITYPARIAIYDNLKSAPQVIEIQGGPTHEYIEKIASLTYQHAKNLGGLIPYAAIREVSENFIHANFNEIVVSILDKGNTIKFCDQGPGIKNKDLVQEPGFTSATEPMKRYIRGVGSGFPLVKEYLQFSHGYIQIEDNVNQGSVVTISLIPKEESQAVTQTTRRVSLKKNEEIIIKLFLTTNTLGITDIHNATGIANSSIHNALKTLEEKGFIEKVGKKRELTKEGRIFALSL
ncbi:MAG: ATP-binding protein [Anaerotardibacter sp.]